MILNRAQMRQKILQARSQAYKDEIAHQMSVEREYAYDEVAAAFDVEDRTETWVSEGSAGARSLLKAARQTLIDIGFYRVMLQQEIDETFTSNGRLPCAFKMLGIPYINDDPAETWMFPEQAGDGQKGGA